ncbi:CAP-associated domain-containing protein [Macrococcus brunensis]|nr:CAP-associated domain-containing protein [Macrococcus brunensis]
MKNIVIKMLLVLAALIGLFLLFYSLGDFNSLEEPEQKNKTEEKQKNSALSSGPGTYVGGSIDDWTEDYGYPERIYQADNKYQHYIYNEKNALYDVRVRDGQIGMIYATGPEADIEPFRINQQAAEIFRGTSIDTEPDVSSEDGDYHFELTEVDLKTQLLVQYDDIYAQVYIDRQTGKVMAARFMTAPLLVQMLPYTAHLNGQPLERTMRIEQSVLQEQNAQQTVVELINMMRANYEIHPLDKIENNAPCQKENSITAYDSAEAVNQWLNQEQREKMLNNHYNSIVAAVSDCYAVSYRKN